MLAIRKRSVVSAGSSPRGSVVDVVEAAVVEVDEVLELVELDVVGRAPGGRVEVVDRPAWAPVRTVVDGATVVVVVLVVVDIDVVVVVVVGAAVVGPAGTVVVVVGVGNTGRRTPKAASWRSSPWRATATDAL